MALRGPTGRAFASLILFAAAACVWSASTQAATVTVGSPISRSIGSGGTQGPSGNTETVANTALPEAGAHVTSPVNGTIVRWRMVASGGGGSYALRVLRPAGAGAYKGVGRAPVTGVDGDTTFTASLPIQAGDLIALDLAEGTENGVSAVSGVIAGARWDAWLPAIPEGVGDTPFTSNFTQELAFNAVVQYPDPAGSAPITPAPTTPTKKKCKKKHKRSAESAKKKKCKKKKR
jgi:hypothetical protein